MAISIGVDYVGGQWRYCVIDQGNLSELHTFADAGTLLTALNQTCTLYPEPGLVLALNAQTPLRALSTLTEPQLVRLLREDAAAFAFPADLAAMQTLYALSIQSYCAPAVAYLPTVPAYRRLLRAALGDAGEVCTVVALLHHMREQGAGWQEMNFIYLHLSERGICALVVQDGRIVNGIARLQGSGQTTAHAQLRDLEYTEAAPRVDSEVFQTLYREAFWEGLTQELAGLLAIHHLEDLVVLGQQSDELVERLADTYQVYLFPHAQSEATGYEAALGAAILAEGLNQPGTAAELVDYLQITSAHSFTIGS